MMNGECPKGDNRVRGVPCGAYADKARWVARCGLQLPPIDTMLTLTSEPEQFLGDIRDENVFT